MSIEQNKSAGQPIEHEATRRLTWMSWVDHLYICVLSPAVLVASNRLPEAGETHLMRLGEAVDRVVANCKAHAWEMPNYICGLLDSTPTETSQPAKPPLLFDIHNTTLKIIRRCRRDFSAR